MAALLLGLGYILATGVAASWHDDIQSLNLISAAACPGSQSTSDCKRFQGSFSDGTWGYLVPLSGNSGGARSGLVARILLSDFATVETLDLTTADSSLRGYSGGFSDGIYGYVIPHYKDGEGHGKVARWLLSDFSTSTVEVLNLEAHHPDLRYFKGGFTDGTWGYASPFRWGRVARWLLSDFTTVESLDLTTQPDFDTVANDVPGQWIQFWAGFVDGTWGYLHEGVNTWAVEHGKMVRFLLSDFTTAETLDLATHSSDFYAFESSFSAGGWGYLIPFQPGGSGNGIGGRSGNLARFSLTDFAAVESLDLALLDPELAGFRAGWSDGTFGYAVPSYRTKVARWLLSDTTTVEFLDLKEGGAESYYNFMTGFISGNYGYACSWDSGWLVRFGLDSTGWQTLATGLSWHSVATAEVTTTETVTATSTATLTGTDTTLTGTETKTTTGMLFVDAAQKMHNFVAVAICGLVYSITM